MNVLSYLQEAKNKKQPLCFYSPWTFKDVQFWGFGFNDMTEVGKNGTGTAQC